MADNDSKKQHIPVRISETNLSYIDARGASHWPPLRRSTVIDLIITERRLLDEKRILSAEGHFVQQVQSVLRAQTFFFELLLDRATRQQEMVQPLKCEPTKRTRGIA